jgi:predicted GNAT family N-acyltransferase
MGLKQVDRLDDGQVAQLHALFQEEWWTRGRTLDDVRRMVERTQVVLGFLDDADGDLVAFARAITDDVYKALVLDVIVRADQRGTGLGARLMDAMLHHPRLAEVQHVELYCRPELVPFYERWGFTADLGELRFLRRDTHTAVPIM